MSETINYIIAHYAQWLYLLATVSIIILLLSVLLVPLLVARIPEDYFIAPIRPSKTQPFSWYRYIRLIVRNIVGTLLLLAGIAMLLLPGQGILTILAGLFMVDFPGKYKLERYIVCKPAILNSINWIRRRQNIPEIRIN